MRLRHRPPKYKIQEVPQMTLSQVTQVEPEPLNVRLMGGNTAETDIKELHVCV